MLQIQNLSIAFLVLIDSMSEMNEIKSTKTRELIKQSKLKHVKLFASRTRLKQVRRN